MAKLTRRWTTLRHSVRLSATRRSVPAPAQSTTWPHGEPPPLALDARGPAARVDRSTAARCTRSPSSRAEPVDRPLRADRAAARVPEQRAGVRRQRRVALAGGLDHRRVDARRAQPRGVGLDVAAEPQRALLPQQRLAGPLRPRVPAGRGRGPPRDLLARRVQVAEAARDAGRLAGARQPPLEHHDVGAAARERVRGGEPDDAAADYRDVRSGRYPGAPRARRAAPAARAGASRRTWRRTRGSGRSRAATRRGRP